MGEMGMHFSIASEWLRYVIKHDLENSLIIMAGGDKKWDICVSWQWTRFQKRNIS